MRTSSRAVLATAVALCCASAGSALAAPAGTPVGWSADGCAESVANVLVPVERLQAALPQGYVARALAPGQGTLYVAVAECASLTVGGVTEQDVIVSDVGIGIEPLPDLGRATYHVWQVVSSRRLHERTARLGLRGALTDGSLERTATPGPQTARGEVTSSLADYVVEATGAAAAPLAGGRSTWVHQGPRGRVVTSYSFAATRAAQGASTVTTPASSALGQLLGSGTGVSAVGYVIEPFDISAKVSRQR